MKRFIFIGMLLCVLCSSAQVSQVKQDSVRVYFRQDKSVVDLSYRDNTSNFSRLAERYKFYNHNFKFKLKGIRVVSSASPEATFAHNKGLAIRRAEAVLDYLKNHSELDTTLLSVQPLGEDWNRLRSLVQADPNVPEREEVLRVLDKHPYGQEGEWDLKAISNGEAYRYIYERIYPMLRQTNVVFDLLVLRECHAEQPSLLRPRPEIPSLPTPERKGFEDTRTIFALKTNLLYDALSWLNFSVEVPLGDRFSALYYHQFPWWTWGEGNNEYCMRFLSIGAEARWWFKPEPRKFTAGHFRRDKLVGHFVGVYAESGKWDFERKRDICYQGEHWSVGLSYGYAMPIGKRLNLELSASVGYASIAYRGYTPSEDYEILWRDPEKVGRWHYFGPTKAQVSLVLPFVVKYKKGGKR